ncbi:hypothetical protein F7725_020556 [Dissostichus mawsoni]|uniref:Uncharacterized protein n=1 Tax=Dissostichus mawsoni TaxID=36200 RepID=A0A7J5YGY4_DISMA|nr:hypothetical protein F7725_020556 [Dissostichus mawsoni]
MANPLVAFTLIKQLHSEWLNVVHSNEAQENTQGWLSAFFTDTSGALRSSYEKEEADLPKLEDLQGGRPGADEAAGCVAYEQQDYYHSVQWLEESLYFPMIEYSIGERDPAVDILSTPVLCKAIYINSSPIQVLFQAAVNILFFAVFSNVMYKWFLQVFGSSSLGKVL